MRLDFLFARAQQYRRTALQDDLFAAAAVAILSEIKGPLPDALRAGDWARWFHGRVFLSHHQGMHDAVDPPA